MKRNLILLSIFAIKYCYAGTGGARDLGEFVLAIIVVFAVIIGITYFTKFIIKKIKQVNKTKPIETDQLEKTEIEINNK